MCSPRASSKCFCRAPRGKLESKARGLAALLGDSVTAPLHIDNVPDLGEQKTAWDHVSFEGFLGARMSLQLTWTGLDSALAAPLILDLTRLTALAHAAGEVGPLPGLAFFFKDPVGTDEHRFAEQTTMLTEWATSLAHPQPANLSTTDAAAPDLSVDPDRMAVRGAPGEGGGLPRPLSARAREDTRGAGGSGGGDPQASELSTGDASAPEMSDPAGRLASRGAPGEGGGLPGPLSARAREDTPSGGSDGSV